MSNEREVKEGRRGKREGRRGKGGEPTKGEVWIVEMTGRRATRASAMILGFLSFSLLWRKGLGWYEINI